MSSLDLRDDSLEIYVHHSEGFDAPSFSPLGTLDDEPFPGYCIRDNT